MDDSKAVDDDSRDIAIRKINHMDRPELLSLLKFAGYNITEFKWMNTLQYMAKKALDNGELTIEDILGE